MQTPPPDIRTSVHLPPLLRADPRDGHQGQGLAPGPVRGLRGALHDVWRPPARWRGVRQPPLFKAREAVREIHLQDMQLLRRLVEQVDLPLSLLQCL